MRQPVVAILSIGGLARLGGDGTRAFLSDASLLWGGSAELCLALGSYGRNPRVGVRCWGQSIGKSQSPRGCKMLADKAPADSAHAHSEPDAQGQCA